MNVLIAGYHNSGVEWIDHIVQCALNARNYGKVRSDGVVDLHVKTHTQIGLGPEVVLSEHSKIIFVIRNPKDVAVDIYKDQFFQEDFETFLGHFTGSLNIVSMTWAKHTKQWLSALHEVHHPHVHIVYFRDLAQDFHQQVSKICNFLGIHLEVEAERRLCHSSRLDSFVSSEEPDRKRLRTAGSDHSCSTRRNSCVVGELDQWKQYFTVNQSNALDEMLAETLTGVNLDLTRV